MAKISVEARQHIPELIETVKKIEYAGRRHGVLQVFDTMIDWAISTHSKPLKEYDFTTKYTNEERDTIKDAWRIIWYEYKKRTALWSGDYTLNGWYDGLGNLMEVLKSKKSLQALDQFFTPRALTNLMAMLIFQSPVPGSYARIPELACGSGRLGIAGAIYAMGKGAIPVPIMNDLDPLCTKLTALNMILNGVAGEVTNMNGLDLVGETYRFGYKVCPALSFFPQEEWPKVVGYYAVYGRNPKKEYVLTPLAYKDSLIKEYQDEVLASFNKERAIAEQKAKETKIKELQTEVAKRMEGTLFEGDQSQLENIAKEMKTDFFKERKKKKSSGSPDDQLTLF